MKSKKVWSVIVTISTLTLINSCKQSSFTKDKSPKKFQTVVFEKKTMSTFINDSAFGYFILEHKPTFFNGILLEVTAFDTNNNVMKREISLGKLNNSKATELINEFPSTFFLTKAKLKKQGVDGSSDYYLYPRAFDRNGRKGNYVSYFFDDQIKTFRAPFQSFILNPCPPAAPPED